MILRRSLLYFVMLSSFSCAAQMTVVTASNIQDAAGNKLKSGTMQWLPTDNNDAPTLAGGGGGNLLPRAACAKIQNGAIIGDCKSGGSFQVVDSTLSFPLNLCYRVSITDTQTNTTFQPYYKCVQPHGASWSWDSYQYPANPNVMVQAGPQGPPGPGLNPRGVWNCTPSCPTPPYAIGDFVGYSDGKIYAAYVTPGSHPPTDTAYWMYAGLDLSSPPPIGAAAPNSVNATTLNDVPLGLSPWYAAQLGAFMTPWLNAESQGGDVTQFAACVASGSCTVTIWGDSISEGVSQVAYENSWAGSLQRILRQRFPTVTFTFYNLSLGSRSASLAANASYLGIGPPDDYPVGYYRAPGGADYPWPDGSTVGKSWQQAVKDTAPDVVFIAFGANDTSSNAADEAYKIGLLTNYCGTFTKVPTTVIVTPYPPTTSSSPWNGQQDQLREFAAVQRGWARANNFPVVDAGRIFQLLRDGTDVVRPHFELDQAFAGYPTNWSTYSGSVLVSGGNATVGAAGWMGIKSELAQDVSLIATFDSSTTANIPSFWYRASASDAFSSYKAELFPNGSSSHVGLYFNGSLLASSGTFTVGSTAVIRVQAIGVEHRVWVDGVLRINVRDYTKAAPGNWGVGIQNNSGTSSGQITSLKAYLGNPVSATTTFATESMLFGDGSMDFGSSMASIGGDGIHHPSMFGHAAIFLTAMEGLLSHVEEVSVAGSRNAYTFVGKNAGIRASGANHTDIVGDTSGGRITNSAHNSVLGEWTDGTAPQMWIWHGPVSFEGPGYFNALSVGGGTAISKRLPAAATLTFTAISAQTCQEQTLTVTGATMFGYGVTASPRADLGNVNLQFGGAWVSANNTVSVRVCNTTSSSITPNAVAWGVLVEQ